jgi:hypothetical protein
MTTTTTTTTKRWKVLEAVHDKQLGEKEMNQGGEYACGWCTTPLPLQHSASSS